MPPRPRTRRKKIKQKYPQHRPTLSAVFRDSTVLETGFLVGLVLVAAIVLWTYQYIADSGGMPPSSPEAAPQLLQKTVHLRGSLPKNDNNNQQIISTGGAGGGYEHFSNMAQDLAALPPTEALQKLEQSDPFGTRAFDSKLLEHETTLGRVLTIDEIKQQLFSCPRNEERITLPDARVEQKALDFREGKNGSFLFFQHLRKAGGTNFCSLATKNLPKKAQPHYYCMPDMAWSGNKNAGYLHSWPNEEIITRMKSSGFRIAGNEWENFDVTRHFDLPAVFATSFRKPLDRALSQFRFECIEDRGCRIKDVHKWWETRKDLWNVYTKTFADPPVGARKYFRGDEFAKERRNFMAEAIGTLSKFHIVLSMEWLAYGGPQVRSVLGFDDVSALTTRVRPHIGQAKRDDGQDKNNLGSASIAKASWVPKEYLDAEQYKKMSEDLVLDEILTDAARRMFLERLVCEDVGGGVAIQ
mmetsp:Transcript_5722/g.11077  ORF Transcript_5722/g.11077 Transcript_5722/m.11077 type:complete len:469 (-) Transcript_5722:44-1450(-)